MLQLKNSITVLKSNDIVLQEPANIEAHTLEFYRNLFAANNNTQQNNFIELVIPKLVSAEDNCALMNLPSMNKSKRLFLA